MKGSGRTSMNWFQRIFGKKTDHLQKTQIQSKELQQLHELDSFMRSLLKGEHYVAKSEYQENLQASYELIKWFQVLKGSGMLSEFCQKNGTSEREISQILSRYNEFTDLIDAQNEQYIRLKMDAEKAYLDSILKDCNPNILLDDDQRRVVLTDEDYCLVVAGAGAGKTTTVAAKVKYLVEKKQIDPKEILVISFTNKAVNELKQRIIGDLHIECPIATFHSTGNAILHIHNPEKLNIVDDSKLYYVVQDYFRESILRNESAVNNLILFFRFIL